MFCKNCGAKIADKSAFCSICGAKQDNINLVKTGVNESTDEEIYQEDLKKKKKRLLILGAVIAIFAAGVFCVNNSITAGPQIGFSTKLQAILGDAEAEYKIANSLHGAEKFMWLEKSASKGHADAQAELGYCYYSGEGAVKDFKEALKWFQRAADNGSVYGQFRMGWAYSNGEGVAKDQKLAVSWYKKAADNGNTAAMNNLAVCYANGEGVAKDTKKSFELYQEASEKGNLLSTLNLARAYELGEGTNVDKKKAFELYKKVASKDSTLYSDEDKEYVARGIYNVGKMYFCGNGVEKNYEEAVKYFNLAKNQGNMDALCGLGIAYYFGQGVPVDREQGKKLVREASERGHARAKSLLKLM